MEPSIQINFMFSCYLGQSMDVLKYPHTIMDAFLWFHYTLRPLKHFIGNSLKVSILITLYMISLTPIT